MPGELTREVAAVSLSSSTNEYAIRRKKHLDLIKQLRAIGAQADLDLPRITVIGNQSAGKSSLVEAISGISVPRDAGTCTRCPMECRLASSNEPWSCQVYIRWEFLDNKKRKEEVEEVPFGSLIKDKADVELALRRAQCAVLNPHKSMDSFIRASAADLKKVENKLLFSPNTVCLDLSGPDLTDLAFVDLPGIIQNADPETVNMVEDLVMSHIHGNCLILVTIPMSDDIENQKAVRLAKQVDPTGQRTIGVLTKPDTLTVGAVKAKQIWLDVLEGRRFQTTHGYYCTRQPDDDERTRGITTTEARDAEQAFFKSTVPWNTSRDRYRFGTGVLVENLARILSHIIDETLPELHNKVNSQLADCTSRLAELPPPVTSDPASFVLNLVLEFSTKVRRLVEGDITASSLVQANRQAYARYKIAVRDSALLFLPYVDAKEDTAPEALHLFSSMDDGDEVVNAEDMKAPASGKSGTKRHMYLADVRKRVNSAVTRELPDNVPYPVKVSLIQQSQATWETLSRACFKHVQAEFQGQLDGLVDALFARYDRLRNRMIQFVKDLVKQKQADTLKRICHILELELVPYTQNNHYLQETKAKYLAQFKDARTGKLAISTRTKTKRTGVGADGTGSEDEAEGYDGEGYDGEGYDGEGYDGEGYDGEGYEGEGYEGEWNEGGGSEGDGSEGDVGGRGLSDEDRIQAENQVLSLLATLGYRRVTVTDLGRLNPPDMYETELELMAEVRAYTQISYKRVIDNIPMTVDRAFLYGFADAMREYLVERLALGTPGAAVACATYLAEDPHIVALREELMAKERRLTGVQRELDNFDE